MPSAPTNRRPPGRPRVLSVTDHPDARASASASYGRPSPGAAFAAQLDQEAGKRPRAKSLRPLRKLAPYLARRRSEIALALVFLLGASLTTLALPLAARELIDNGLVAGDTAATNARFVLIGAVAAAIAVFSAARYYFVTRIGERVVADLRADVYDRLVGLSPGFFARMGAGEALSRLTTDAQVIETLVSSSGSIALRNMITAGGGLILLFVTEPRLAAFLLLIVPAALLLLFALGRQVRARSVTTQDRLADAAAAAAEALDGIDTVQAFGREDHARARFRGAIEAAFAASLARMKARALLTAGVILLVFGGVCGVLYLGAKDVISGALSAGALTQFVFLAVLTGGAAAALAEAWGDVQKASGATERLTALLDERADICAPAAPKALPSPARGEIALEGVSFAYPAASAGALHDVHLRVRPGETVALVGPSGAGKSTLFRLLLRLYDPDRGVVRLDGIDAREADPQAWRARFAYVSQDAALFSGDAADNIAFGREGASTAEIEAAARAAEAEPFILARPEGYRAQLGPRARQLSGGERQRLALARALVRNAPVLLLDEATSALDAENERLVQRAIETARAGRTTLIIAHRLATVLRADRIVVLDQGRIVDEGRHEELVARGGLYARFAALQFSTNAA